MEDNNTGFDTEPIRISVPPPPDDHANQPPGTQIATNGSRKSGKIEKAGDVDYFNFHATEGRKYVIETHGNMDAYLHLYDRDGSTQLDTDDDDGEGSNSKIEWLCPPNGTGTYFVKVRHYSPSSTGEYSVSVTEVFVEFRADTVNINLDRTQVERNAQSPKGTGSITGVGQGEVRYLWKWTKPSGANVESSLLRLNVQNWPASLPEFNAFPTDVAGDYQVWVEVQQPNAKTSEKKNYNVRSSEVNVDTITINVGPTLVGRNKPSPKGIGFIRGKGDTVVEYQWKWSKPGGSIGNSTFQSVTMKNGTADIPEFNGFPTDVGGEYQVWVDVIRPNPKSSEKKGFAVPDVQIVHTKQDQAYEISQVAVAGETAYFIFTQKVPKLNVVGVQSGSVTYANPGVTVRFVDGKRGFVLPIPKEGEGVFGAFVSPILIKIGEKAFKPIGDLVDLGKLLLELLDFLKKEDPGKVSFELSPIDRDLNKLFGWKQQYLIQALEGDPQWQMEVTIYQDWSVPIPGTEKPGKPPDSIDGRTEVKENVKLTDDRVVLAAPSTRQLLTDYEPIKSLPVELQQYLFNVLLMSERGHIWSVPRKTAVAQNYPNPFNPETWIPFQLAESVNVTLTIYDVNGKRVRQLNLGLMSPGHYTTRDRAAYWDGCNETGEFVASGVYFYELRAGSFRGTRRMTRLK